MDGKGESILTWIQGMKIHSKKCTSLNDLVDGVVFLEILSQASPSHFAGLSINKSAGANRVLRSTNLKKLVKYLEEYYVSALGVSEPFEGISPELVAREEDKEETLRLASLVLAASLQSRNRDLFIPKIMELDGAIQRGLMLILQDIQSQYPSMTSENVEDENLKEETEISEEHGFDFEKDKRRVESLEKEINSLRENNVLLKRKYDDMESSNILLQSRCEELDIRLRDEVNRRTEERGSTDRGKSGRNEERESIENIKYDLRIKVKEIETIKFEFETEIERLREELRKSSDDNESSKWRIEELEKEMGITDGLKKKIKELEEKNISIEKQRDSHFVHTLDLQEKYHFSDRQVEELKQRLESRKREIQELQLCVEESGDDHKRWMEEKRSLVEEQERLRTDCRVKQEQLFKLQKEYDTRKPTSGPREVNNDVELKAELENVKREKEMLMKKLRSRAEGESVDASRVVELEEELMDAKHQLDVYNQRMENESNRLKEIIDEDESLRTTVKELESEMNDMRELLHTKEMEIESLNNRVKEQSNELSEMRNKTDTSLATEMEMSSLKRENKQVIESRDRMEKAVVAQTREVRKLKRETIVIQSALDNLLGENEQLKKKSNENDASGQFAKVRSHLNKRRNILTPGKTPRSRRIMR